MRVSLQEIAPRFLDMAHQIVFCTVATVDAKGRPRSRVVHAIWEWDDQQLTGWFGSRRRSTIDSNIAQSPWVSCNYWASTQDTCVADCAAEWRVDLESRQHLWDLFCRAPQPVGFDPSIVRGWTDPAADEFNPLCLKPWRLRVLSAEAMMAGGPDNAIFWAADAG